MIEDYTEYEVGLRGTARVIERLSRGRVRATREDEYTIETGRRA